MFDMWQPLILLTIPLFGNSACSIGKRYALANAETQGGGGGAQADLIHFLEVNFGAPEAYVDQTFIDTYMWIRTI